MFYAIFVPSCSNVNNEDGTTKYQPEDLIFTDIKEANSILKTCKDSRMKTFEFREEALAFTSSPDLYESFIGDSSKIDLVESLEKLSLSKDDPEEKPKFLSPTTAELSDLRKKIEKGSYEEVEKIIWSNPRILITVSDSAVYLMAGPKYNACHIAARANKPDIIALILDVVSNHSFMKRLYDKESDENVQARVTHLLDSYLNTPDPRTGSTPLHFASRLGHYRVVRILLTFEACDQHLRDSNGLTAEETICSNAGKNADPTIVRKIKDMFKSQLHLPLHRDQLKKRLLMTKRRSRAGANFDSDTSFSEDSFISVTQE